MSTRPDTPQCSGVPRPVGPKNPVAWLSSTITSAPYRSARSQSCRQRRDVAVHGEHAIGHDQPRPSPSAGLQDPLELGHVAVGVPLALRLAEPDAVDDRGVVERVGDDGVRLVEQRLEEARRWRRSTRCRGSRPPCPRKRAMRRLELLVDRLGAADEPDARRARTPSAPGRPGRPGSARVVGEAEVVVGAEVEHLPAAHGHAARPAGPDDAFVLPEPRHADVVQLALQSSSGVTVHEPSPVSAGRTAA